MDPRIEEAGPAVAATIESRLLASLRSRLTQAENSSFVLTAVSSTDELVGGLTASVSYGWLLTKLLWVDESYRHQGLGTRLMAKAELKAASLGCHSAWLETSNPDAKTFYEGLGYIEFGRLSNDAGQFPETHRRWFLRKPLEGSRDQ